MVDFQKDHPVVYIIVEKKNVRIVICHFQLIVIVIMWKKPGGISSLGGLNFPNCKNNITYNINNTIALKMFDPLSLFSNNLFNTYSSNINYHLMVYR